MLILGLNAVYHDSAACLVEDGRVVAAAEEERFSRVKHAKRPVPFSTWELPFGAVDYCLGEVGAVMADVDHVGYSFDPVTFAVGGDLDRPVTLPLEPSASPANDDEWESPWDPLFLSYVVNAPRQLAAAAPHHLGARFADLAADGPYRWHFLDHHLCHAASAFFPSPFERAAVLTLDGRGERATTTYALGEGDHLETFAQVDVPHSLGMLYERVTEHLGFLHSSDEYKVMALASYGRPVFAPAFREMVRVGAEGRFTVELPDLGERFFRRRQRGEALEQRHFDLAASLQVVLEETVLRLVEWLHGETGVDALCLAGGIGLNCVLNARIRDEGPFREVWVQPAAGDAGTALGAALWLWSRFGQGLQAGRGLSGQAEEGAIGACYEGWERALHAVARPEADVRVPSPPGLRSAPPAGAIVTASRNATTPITRRRPRYVMESALLGPSFADEEIEAFLRWSRVPYRRLEDVAGETADLLVQDRIIGWFQGRMEFGPRALGARSILASPLDPDMKERLNDLKDREDFRPVAPVVLEERAGEWFEGATRSPFMLFVFPVAPGKEELIPAVRHVDGTARIQTVNQEQHPRYWELLRAFEERTGVPVLVNTSFNSRGEPIVCSPRDAVECFWTSPLDDLVIGSFLLQKGQGVSARRAPEAFGGGSPGAVWPGARPRRNGGDAE